MDHNTMINELITIPTLTSFKNDEEKKMLFTRKTFDDAQKLKNIDLF